MKDKRYITLYSPKEVFVRYHEETKMKAKDNAFNLLNLYFFKRCFMAYNDQFLSSLCLMLTIMTTLTIPIKQLHVM